MQPETTVFRNMLLAVGRNLRNVRLFRNVTATVWVGRCIERQGSRVVLEAAQQIKVGLFDGSGDGIGWVSKIVTPDMVGQKVAIFASMETKATGGLQDNQRIWMRNVQNAGGIAAVVKRVEDALEAMA